MPKHVSLLRENRKAAPPLLIPLILSPAHLSSLRRPPTLRPGPSPSNKPHATDMLGPGHAWAGGGRQQVSPQACPPAPEGAFKPIEIHPERGSQTSVARAGITTVPLSYRDGQGHICPFP